MLSHSELMQIRREKLSRTIGLKPDEDLKGLLRRTLILIMEISEDLETSLVNHYDLRRFLGWTTLTRSSFTGQREVFLLHSATGVLEEVLGTMRAEKKFPGQYDLWGMLEFFTTERALRAGVSLRAISAIRTHYEHWLDEDVGTFLIHNSRSDLLRTAHLGRVLIQGIVAMLATENLSLRD